MNENVPCKKIECNILKNIESIAIEINLRKRKWLILGLYKPPQHYKNIFLENLSNQLNDTLRHYENVLLLGDFNLTPVNKSMVDFLSTHDLNNLINEPTCFTGKTPTCIDLILTNQKQYFMKSKTFITGISDFRALTTSIMKQTYSKGNPKIKFYRNYKQFNKDHFDIDLKQKLRSLPNLTYEDFEDTFLRTLDKHAPIKKKILRANENAFTNKTLRKAIMIRSNLKNIYLKKRNDTNWTNYKKQRNFCTNLLRNTKKDYFSNLNVKELNDNKKFWKIVKPFFSDKVRAKCY